MTLSVGNDLTFIYTFSICVLFVLANNLLSAKQDDYIADCFPVALGSLTCSKEAMLFDTVEQLLLRTRLTNESKCAAEGQLMHYISVN